MIHFIREDHEVIKYDSIQDALDKEIFFDHVIIVDFEVQKTLIYNSEGFLEKTI